MEVTEFEFTDQERNTILAGLRRLQWDGALLPRLIENIATDNGKHPMLDHDAIDELCERIPPGRKPRPSR